MTVMTAQVAMSNLPQETSTFTRQVIDYPPVCQSTHCSCLPTAHRPPASSPPPRRGRQEQRAAGLVGRRHQRPGHGAQPVAGGGGVLRHGGWGRGAAGRCLGGRGCAGAPCSRQRCRLVAQGWSQALTHAHALTSAQPSCRPVAGPTLHAQPDALESTPHVWYSTEPPRRLACCRALQPGRRNAADLRTS